MISVAQKTVSLQGWRFQRCLFGPALRDSHVECFSTAPEVLQPFCQRSSGSLDGNTSVDTRVAILFVTRRPSHIARLVVAIVVDTIKRMFWRRLLADVGEKRFVRIIPPITHSDASCSIASVVGGERVIATALHLSPRVVCDSAAFSRVTMPQIDRRSVFFPMCDTKTSARVRTTTSQDERTNDSFVAAFADTFPSDSILSPGAKPQNGPTAKTFTCEINHSHSRLIAQEG